MKRVTYLENGVRRTRTCDFIDVDDHNVIALCYKDGIDSLARPIYRMNILSPETVIEKCEEI